MLDIDLDFLFFLLNPSYDYIKDDIKAMQDTYLEDTPSTELDKKRNNFNEAQYLFCNTLDELEIFIKKFKAKLIKVLYKKLYNYFSLVMINIDDDISRNDFITKILNNNNIWLLFGEDKEIEILKNNIRNYLIDIINTTDNDNYKNKATEVLEYMDKLLEKYDKIIEVLNHNIVMVDAYHKYRLDKAVEIMKKIMIENIDLFDEYELEVINNSDNYSKISKIFNKKFFSYGIYENYKRTTEKQKMFSLVDMVDCYDNKKYISDGEIYFGEEIKEAIEDDVLKYNDIYEKNLKLIRDDYLREQLLSQFEKIYYSDYFFENEHYIIDDIIEYLEKNNNVLAFTRHCNCDNNKLVIVVNRLISTIKFHKDKMISSFYHNLSHEIGHVYDGALFNLYNIFNKEFNVLGECYVDYRSIKIMDELIYSKKVNKDGVYLLCSYSNYSNYFFLLLDIFEKYKNYFDEFLLQDSISPLKDLIGRDLLFEIIDKLKEFDLNKARNDYEYAKYYLDYAEEVLNIIDEKQSIVRNLDSYKNFSEFKRTEVLEKTKKR